VFPFFALLLLFRFCSEGGEPFFLFLPLPGEDALPLVERNISLFALGMGTVRSMDATEVAGRHGAGAPDYYGMLLERFLYLFSGVLFFGV
jgi:hypothetical protein